MVTPLAKNTKLGVFVEEQRSVHVELPREYFVEELHTNREARLGPVRQHVAAAGLADLPFSNHEPKRALRRPQHDALVDRDPTVVDDGVHQVRRLPCAEPRK